MSRRFILSTDPLTTEEEAQLGKALSALSSSTIWWHWLPNFWLIKDRADQATVTAVRDALRQINKSARCMAFQVTPGTWSGAVRKNAKGVSMTEWIKNHWETD